MRTVALAHIGDHLVTAVLAEVDVEIGHRYALGVEEALEQKPEADRVEIGDGERVGDQRTRARAASRAHGNALGFRPFDEIGDDEKVSLVVHAGDDIELEGKPRGVGGRVMAGRRAILGDPFLEACLGLAPQLGSLGLGESARCLAPGEEGREDRLAL